MLTSQAHHGQHAVGVAHLALQRELAHDHHTGEVGLHPPAAAEDAQGDGQVVRGPSFLRSAGARFTVMRRMGNSQPELRTAARTRSRDSWTAVSGRPTTVKAGRPEAISASTSTMTPCMPMSAQVLTLVSISRPDRRWRVYDASSGGLNANGR